MSGTGYLVAIDSYRDARTDMFMHELDQLMLGLGGQPNLSKDSRIPRDVAEQSIASFTEFKRGLFKYDRERTMRSEMSQRIGLL
jgi:decaprenylphospho-beta-D-ribofuranose 2-oxidase